MEYIPDRAYNPFFAYLSKAEYVYQTYKLTLEVLCTGARYRVTMTDRATDQVVRTRHYGTYFEALDGLQRAIGMVDNEGRYRAGSSNE